MFGETSKLLDVNHRLRDTLDEVLVEIARKEQRLDSVAAGTGDDPLTGVSGRAGLEAELSRWQTDDAQRQRVLSAALIDLDGFAQVNERFGQKAGDKILRAVGQLLTAERQHGGTVARVAGQRFFLLFPDTDIRAATNAVERIRQTVELARFRYRDEDLRLTVSCAVTEAGAEDTSAALHGAYRGHAPRGEALWAEPHLPARREVPDAGRPAQFCPGRETHRTLGRPP